jgi:hypothetical protein
MSETVRQTRRDGLSGTVHAFGARRSSPGNLGVHRSDGFDWTESEPPTGAFRLGVILGARRVPDVDEQAFNEVGVVQRE